MKKWLMGALVFAAVFSVSKATSYLIGAVQTQQQVTQVNQRANDPKSEPVIDLTEAKKEFMEGCDTGTLSGQKFNQNAYCVCVYDKTVQNHGINKLAQVGLNGTDQEIVDLMQDEATYCLSQQGIKGE